MSLITLYNQLSRWPLGTKIFSAVVCKKAPYFGSISPRVTMLTENQAIIAVKKRRKVLNHIKTIHAIAMCNASELAAGLLMEAGLPKQFRWIPKEMKVAYLKKAQTNIHAVTKIADWSSIQLGDNNVLVEVFDDNNEVVMTANINMWISTKN